MKIKFFNRRSLAVLCLVVASFFVGQFVQAVGTAEPGSEGDPIVSKSYVDAKSIDDRKYSDLKNAELKTRLDETTKLLEATNIALAGMQQMMIEMQTPKYVVVNLKAGQKLICDESTELIVRGGKATAIASESGGLSNISSAKEIAEGQIVPLNNLVLIPRTDGRGVKANAESWIMVRGTYRIE